MPRAMLRASRLPSAFAEVIRSRKKEIIHQWEEEVRSAIPAAAGLERLALVNSLPVFLENLANALESPRKPDGICFENECGAHGRQRAELGNYELEQIVSEYHILTRVLLREADSTSLERPVAQDEREQVLRFVDLALEEVSDSFVNSSRASGGGESDRLTIASVEAYERVGGIAALVASGIGAVALLGHLTGKWGMTTLVEGTPTTAAASALCLFLLGAAAWLFRTDIFTTGQRRLAFGLAGIVGFLAFVRLIAIVLRWELTFLPIEGMSDRDATGRMALMTAVSLLFLSPAVILLGVRKSGSTTLSQALSLFGAAIAGWTLTAYLYGFTTPGPARFTQMGILTAIALFTLSGGLLLSRPDVALMEKVTSPGPGGYMARRLIPAVVVVPFLVGWLRVVALPVGAVSINVGAALIVGSLTLFFTGLVWWLAGQINRIAQERRRFQRETMSAIVRREEMHRALLELEAERDLRERFVSALSHDLRSPLAAIRMSSDLGLRYPEKVQNHPRLFQRISDGVKRADRMIRDLLDANRLRAGEPIPMTFEECELKSVAEEVCDELSFIHGDRFVVRAQGDSRGVWSRDGLRRIVENLCSNAVKYGEDASPVTVEVRDHGPRVSLSVHNRGNPIPEEEQKRIFEVHRRTASAQQSRNIGWGLGLALVRGLVDAHRGEVMVRSSAEEGTTFVVTLPRKT